MSRPRILLGVAGVAAMAWSAWLVLTGGIVTPPVGVATWLAAVVVAHDLVLAPIVVGLGWLAARVVPEGARTPVAVAFLVGGSVVVMSAPLWLGQLLNRLPTTNASVDPLDYPRNVLVLVTAICLLVGLGALVRSRVRRARHRVPAGTGRSSPPPPNAPSG